MAMAEKSKSGDAARPKTLGTPFSDMQPATKVRWVLKLAVCVISFGFIFPNVMSD
jgi:hypothetical protein